MRVAAHVHSDWSYDGSWSLGDLARLFGRLRYDAVLMSEHDRGFDGDRWREYATACSDASKNGALLVPGIEYSDAANAAHVLVWGADDFLGEGLETVDMLRAARAASATAVLAHPARRRVHERVEPEWLELLDGIEIWNRKYDGIAPSADAFDLLAREARLRPFVGFDFHRARQLYPISMTFDGRTGRDPDAVFEALSNAAYRARPIGLSVSALRNPAVRKGLLAAEGFRSRAARARRRSRGSKTR